MISKNLKKFPSGFKTFKPLIESETKLEGYITSAIDKTDVDKKSVIQILKKADFNISDILIDEEEKDIPDGLLEFLEKQVKTPSNKLGEIKNKRRSLLLA